ncbi:hypothetical protein J437_LFUL010316 [Ladona fulva]|uniref:NF-kappa-B inhibitor zeta n=1 Tax=Ladona fulva TaxID=123851 RepID=A0A8K0KBE1_LADFU|nr:hypothetical protein J437_LFUL010316 [Ladona fulva]
MKAERPTRHKPVTEEDAGSPTGGSTDDISDCLSRLAICSTDSSKPNSTQVSKEKDAEEKKESNEKDDDKEKTEKAKPKDEEKEEPEKEDVLLSRGPDPVVHKYRSQAAASQSPYPKAVHQVNHTHGGCTVYEQSPPPLCSYLPESCGNQRNIYPNVLPDLGSDFFETTETSLPINIGEYPPVGASIPDENISKIIEEVTNDPQKMKKVVEDLLTAAKTATLNIDLESSSVPRHSQESCQVVPQRHPSSSSAYSASSGSPPGPSSPNYYGKTPIFSPNVPSPQVGAYDESHMYSPPYCSNYQSSLQRPLSSCSSSSTNCSSADLDFDLNVMIRPTDREKERKVVEELEKDLPASNSDNNLAYYMASPNCLGPVPPANNPTIYLVVHDNLQLGKKKTDVITSNSSRTPRPILPKLSPSGLERSSNHSQDIRGWMPQSRVAARQSSYQLPMQEQLLQRLDPIKKMRAWTQVMSHTDETLTKVDFDGDTSLMILVCSSEILQKLEQLHALVERYKKIPGALALRNKLRQINEENGNSLIHYLCQDDKYSVLLDGLLSMKNKRGRCCFDFNKRNHEGQSPLHLAVETHNKGIPCLKIVNVLLRHGADILTKDGKQGSTALHLALSTCAPDKDLIHVLCNYSDNMTDQFIQGRQTNVKVELVNSKDLKGDTPMHIAMAYLGLMESQNPNHVIEILLKAGAVRSIRNNNGKVPLELAPENHKVEMKRLLDRYNGK